MKSTSSPTTGNTLAWVLMAYVAVLPLAQTIALRHVIMAVALMLVVKCCANVYQQDSLRALRSIPFAWLPFFAWWGYLCVFPLLSESPEVAWGSFLGDWLMSIGAGVIGWVAAISSVSSGPGIVALVVACMAPVLIHWALILLSWTGLLGPSVPLVMSWSQVWDALQTQLSSGVGAWIGNGTFRWQFHGFDPDHGNLGLAATQSIALLCPMLITAWHQRNRSQFMWVFVPLILCFGSVVLAMSRGAQIFSLLIFVAAFVLQFFRRAQRISPRLPGLWGVVLVLSLGLVGLALAKDARWAILGDKVQAAQMVEDPVRFFCDGLTPELEERVRSHFKHADPAYVDSVVSGMGGDGGRFLAAKAGLVFVAAHPFGVDGSRHVFKNLIKDACGGPPKLEFAHTHNGWLDLLLSLGWFGAVLYFSALIVMMCWAFKRFQQNPTCLWAQALLLTLVFWLFRGLVDSVYREHALLMQAAMIMYLAARSRCTKA